MNCIGGGAGFAAAGFTGTGFVAAGLASAGFGGGGVTVSFRASSKRSDATAGAPIGMKTVSIVAAAAARTSVPERI